MDNRLFLTWTKDLQSIAQAGLYYGKDVFDRERYEKIREISAQMMSEISDLDEGKVKDLFCNEIGYQTPKIDTRSAIFKNDRILLVREKNGTWSLPGVCKMFFECSITGGEFKENSETTAVDFFTENSLPDLAIEKNNEEQLKMCFKAHRDEHWMPLVE